MQLLQELRRPRRPLRSAHAQRNKRRLYVHRFERRFQRSTTSYASARAARSALSLAAPVLMSPSCPNTHRASIRAPTCEIDPALRRPAGRRLIVSAPHRRCRRTFLVRGQPVDEALRGTLDGTAKGR